MSRNLLRAAGPRLSAGRTQQLAFSVQDVVWALGSFCALNRKPFDGSLLIQQFPPPYSSDSFIHAARALGFRIKRVDCDSKKVGTLNFPCLVVVNAEQIANHAAANDEQGAPTHRPAIVVQVNDQHVAQYQRSTAVPAQNQHRPHVDDRKIRNSRSEVYSETPPLSTAIHPNRYAPTSHRELILTL
jgi:subfamily B ATP-binding cassette protein HlyB/CyaB